MALQINGLGIRWAASGITMTAGIVSSTSGQKVQSIDFERTSELGEIKNEFGETVGEVYYNKKKVLRLSVVPCAVSGTNTIANATSSVDGHLIAPGTKITVVDGNGTIMDGDYNLDSAKGRGQNTEAFMVDIEMHKFDDNDVTTVVT